MIRGPSGTVVGLRVDRVDYDSSVARILEAARAAEPLRVAAANVHLVMECRRNLALAHALAEFELVVPDGQPVRWMLDETGPVVLGERVYGPELARRVCIAAAREALPIFLYGTTEATLDALSARLRTRIAPGIQIAGQLAPPFGEALWRAAEADARRIRASGARIVLVGLGCPRQERWVGENAQRTGAACLAVGAAFDLLAGRKPMAPRWMQAAGLEWAFRLATEPGRTFRRYALHNPRFAVLALRQLLRSRVRRSFRRLD